MKKHTLAVFVAVVVGAVAFYGGMLYGKSSGITAQSLQNLSQADRQQLFQSFRGSGGASGGRQGQNNGGFVSGKVISKDNQSITVQANDGSSRIIFYSSSTSVVKPSPASISDIALDNSVTVTGTANSDGSFTAQSIQVREAPLRGTMNQ